MTTKKGSIVCVVTLLANSISHDKDKGNEKKRFNKQVGAGGGGGDSGFQVTGIIEWR